MCFELKTDNPDFCKALYIEAQMFAEKRQEAEAKVIMILYSVIAPQLPGVSPSCRLEYRFSVSVEPSQSTYRAMLLV